MESGEIPLKKVREYILLLFLIGDVEDLIISPYYAFHFDKDSLVKPDKVDFPIRRYSKCKSS